MTWGLMAGFVVGAVVILGGAVVAALTALWRAQERRDGLR